ncbi:PdxA family protein [Bacteriovorax sp. Seq25_V]|uniref:PdxA family dehydrogenase n=1 Tax=Bacteriovorax sp. Seq25_V TaxID=1201288 RepID=UPI00038A3CBD|nr:4-hydroxythreonine-4-phosphate dehydrogenase PdxA [Bacteriovorax sp. Seq25_V]EQC43559.1 putative 4-hydroxythreonine-4-phosphate dehydrogenase PdxA [Bacteriovorax sp. Seq25_V]
MIYVTQGHEKGIGIEVFLKSFLLLSPAKQSEIIFICNKKSVLSTAKILNLPISCDGKSFDICGFKLSCIFIGDDYQTTLALDKAVELCRANDILVTLPTTKDQVKYKDHFYNGHTEYFRAVYQTEVDMFFKSEDANVLLITDHISLAEVPTALSSELINTKIKLCVDKYKKYFGIIKEVFVAGINPHAGEGGRLGKEELAIQLSPIDGVTIKGPLAADGLLITNKFSHDRLFVYMYHDQGLAPFKSLHKTIGANISLGLPYIRLSVDHGTAFELYGKNVADYMGCYYVLKMAHNISNRISNEESK